MNEQEEDFLEQTKELHERFQKVITDFYPEGVNYLNLGAVTASSCKLMIGTIIIVNKNRPQFDTKACLIHLAWLFQEYANRIEEIQSK